MPRIQMVIKHAMLEQHIRLSICMHVCMYALYIYIYTPPDVKRLLCKHLELVGEQRNQIKIVCSTSRAKGVISNKSFADEEQRNTQSIIICHQRICQRTAKSIQCILLCICVCIYYMYL